MFRVCAEARLSCGWEFDAGDALREERPVEGLRDSNTARAFIDWIVKQRPGYRWAAFQGVVNVAPIKPKTRSLLDRHVWIDLWNVPADKALEQTLRAAGLRGSVAASALPSPAALTSERLAPVTGRLSIRSPESQGVRLRTAINRLVVAEEQVQDGGASLWPERTRSAAA